MSSQIDPNQPAVKYLPFRKSHVVAINELTVSALKESARELQKDREDIPYNTALNHIAKSLGFEAGFAGFREKGEPALVEFMSKHELRKPANLVTPRSDLGRAVELTYRQVADRFFDTTQSIPRRIFTGYNQPWLAINDRWFDHNPLKGGQALVDVESAAAALALSKASSPQKVPALLEAAVAGLSCELRSQSNLLDDMLLELDGASFDSSNLLLKLYWGPEPDPEIQGREHDKLRQICRLFREWISRQTKGWVDVLPFNDNLVFLRGLDGRFDFVFKGLRDEPFGKNPFSPYLRSGDIPKSNDTHHYERWLYFEHGGHLERELHEAEARYYAAGGTRMSYPGQLEILKKHLMVTGGYRRPRKDKPRAEGYTTVRLGEEEFNLSDLITIGQFKEFLEDEPGYLEHRASCKDLDDWAKVNLCNSDDLPVAATWYDANAFAAWISRKRGLPVRLPTEEEYTLLRAKLDTSGIPPLVDGMIPWDEWPELLEKDESPNQPPPVAEVDGLKLLIGNLFPNPKPRLTNRYRAESLLWRANRDGLKFLLSPFFGEWLDHEGVAANSAYGSSLCYGQFSPLAGKFTPKSTGRYKGMKVGFRLCYRNGPGKSEAPGESPA